MAVTEPQTRTDSDFKVLVFSRTTPSGYRHASIEAGIRGMKRLAADVSRQSGTKKRKLRPFTVDATEDAAVFDNLSELGQYSVILLLSNSGDDCLDERQLGNFMEWVDRGGGVVGVHCASFACRSRAACTTEASGDDENSAKKDEKKACDIEIGRVWYGDLLGSVFQDHPVPQDGVVSVVAQDKKTEDEGDEVGHVEALAESGKQEARSHPIHILGEMGMEYLLESGWGTSSTTTSMTGDDKDKDDQASRRKDLKVGTRLLWHDEWYNFVSHPREKLLLSHNQGKTQNFSVLLAVDESTYSGGKHGRDHPIAWCQQFKTETGGGGRCFYTALGHFDEAYEDPWFMGHVLGGIYWAAKLC